MRYRLVTTIDDGESALTRIQNEIENLKVTSRPSEDMKIETLLPSIGAKYEFTVQTKYEDIVAKLRKAEAQAKGPGTRPGPVPEPGKLHGYRQLRQEGRQKGRGTTLQGRKPQGMQETTRRGGEEQYTGIQGSYAKNDDHVKGHHAAAATANQYRRRQLKQSTSGSVRPQRKSCDSTTS